MRSSGLLLSAYPAAPSDQVLGDGSLDAYYRGLGDAPEVRAIELPVDGSGRLVGGKQTLARIAPGWSVALTTVPGTRARLDVDPLFGLASPSSVARSDSVEFVRSVLATAEKIDDALGRRAVHAINLVTAPSAASAMSSANALFDSLVRLHEENSQGPALLVEHCDAYVPTQKPAKGYLKIEDEIEALTGIQERGYQNSGIVINWGRSAIESRSTRGPLEHLTAAREAGVLRGLVFSGCSPAENRYGPAWADTHTPPAPYGADPGEAGSLLSQKEIHRALEQLLPDTLVGVKIGLRPENLSVADRVTRQRMVIERISHALNV